MSDTKNKIVGALSMIASSLGGRRVAVCILCAGSSERMGGNEPKQFIEIMGKTALERSVCIFECCPLVDEIVIVTKEEYIGRCLEITKPYKKVSSVVKGGSTRSESASAGLGAVGDKTTHIVFHDAARPLTDEETVERVIRAAFRYRAASAATIPTDTIKEVRGDMSITSQKDRSTLRAVSTPQAFEINLYITACALAEKDGFLSTDDCSLAEHAGFECKMVECGSENIKITYPHDIAAAEAIIAAREAKKRR